MPFAASAVTRRGSAASGNGAYEAATAGSRRLAVTIGSASGPIGLGDADSRPSACWRSRSLSPEMAGSAFDDMDVNLLDLRELRACAGEGDRSRDAAGDQAAKEASGRGVRGIRGIHTE